MFWKRKGLGSQKWGVLLLAVWLIASGVLQLAPQLTFSKANLVLAVLAVAAGILILMDR